jgi:hypothetical protein
MKGGKTKIFCVCLSAVKYPFGGVETSIKLDVWIVRSPSELDSIDSGEKLSDGVDGHELSDGL